MRTLALEKSAESITAHVFDSDACRRWSCPETILVVTDFLDEESIQFHTIQQARRSGAKVLLVQVERQDLNAIPRTHHLRGALSSSESSHRSQDTAERMAGNLRSSGIGCQPIVVRSVQAKEVPFIARSCCADRVLVSAPIGATDTIAYEIIDRAEIPVCVVARTLSLMSRYQRPTRRVTLVLSLRGQNEIPIGFAGRFARENHAQLSIMHVLPRGSQEHGKNGTIIARFVSQLPSMALRKAELICPVEIVVREGDPSNEILKYDAQCNQDFVILAPPRDAGPTGFSISAVRTILGAAPCPVFVLQEQTR